MNEEKCYICENKYWYMDLNGQWIICPRCDAINASMITLSLTGFEIKENKNGNNNM